MPRKNDDYVSLYCEETNAENSAGLVVHLCRIVPHIHSAVFSALYMCKKSAIEILLFYFKCSYTQYCYPGAFINTVSLIGLPSLWL